MGLVEVLRITVLGTMGRFTEWPPIGGTGHTILVDKIIHLSQPDAFRDMFLAVIQLKTTLTVVIMFLHKLNPFSPDRFSRQKGATWALWIKIIIARVPAAILGLLLDDWMEAHLSNAYVVIAALTVYGVLFIIPEGSSVCTNPRFNKVGQIPTKITFLIGTVQLLVLIPETSRSGSTVLGVMILGCSGTTVAEFSFFLGIPITFGASLLKIVKYFLAGDAFAGPQISYAVPGMLTAFIVSIYFIQFLMSYIRRHDFKFFGHYRIILGMIVLAHFGVTVLISQG